MPENKKGNPPMDSAILSLLGAFLLSIMGLFVFIWSMRKGLLVENPRAASVIFARGEIGRADDPALHEADRAHLQAAAAEPGDAGHAADLHELAQRIAADRSSAFPVFMFIAFAIFWLVLGSVAGLTASLKLHMPDWLGGGGRPTLGRGAPQALPAGRSGWGS